MFNTSNYWITFLIVCNSMTKNKQFENNDSIFPLYRDRKLSCTAPNPKTVRLQNKTYISKKACLTDTGLIENAWLMIIIRFTF